MYNKFISKQSSDLLTYFHSRDQNCFDNQKAYLALPDSKKNTVRELLSDMTKRGLLMRVKEGVYYIIPFEAEPTTFMPDWHLLAGHIVNNAPFYIGYYSALQIHNLITQPSLKEQIVVAKQTKPTTLMIKNIPFQFIYHNQKHFFGSKYVWIDSFHKVLCSDLEKTIVDCLFKPEYAGGIVEIAKAIYTSRAYINFETLLDYVIRFDSQAVVKRLGFLLELLDITTDITEKLQSMKTPSYVVLDTEMPRTGKNKASWSILQNVDSDTILNAITT